MSLRVVVLAAGQGTRMKSARPKVLFEVAGLPMVNWVLEAAAGLAPAQTVVVVGHESARVEAVLPSWAGTVLQSEQNGTAHATSLACDALELAPDDDVMVLPGDTPLVTPEILARLIEMHDSAAAAATVLTTRLGDPAGYGRIIRDAAGNVTAIVEDPDVDETQAAIDEVNAGMYVFRAADLLAALQQVRPDNAQGEYYLPDVVGILAAGGSTLAGVVAPAADLAGVNSMGQLAGAGATMRSRINLAWMQAGVWMLEPDRVYIDARVELEPGVRIYPGVHLEGATSIGAGAEIGPDVHIRDCVIAADARVRYSVLEEAEVGPGADVGPYARLRAGTVLGPQAKAGTFVEMKQTIVGPRSKVPHLSYMGDATIGEDSNVGAGSITCNYDGDSKHPTAIGDRVKIGSDTMLVAPVEIGDDAYTGAGSVITRDVPPGTLAVERSDQKEVRDYAARRQARRKAREGDPA